MNVYDFDGTIYDGDSTIDFFFYSLKKKPSLICYLPKQATGFLLYFFASAGLFVDLVVVYSYRTNQRFKLGIAFDVFGGSEVSGTRIGTHCFGAF